MCHCSSLLLPILYIHAHIYTPLLPYIYACSHTHIHVPYTRDGDADTAYLREPMRQQRLGPFQRVVFRHEWGN
ncbi:hypothetical protein J3F84DRAFT_94039 [Trichoderma pleuroticola]